MVPAQDQNAHAVYADNLVTIFDDSIVLHNYYFPSMKPKRINLDAIRRVEVREPSLATGRWRLHGTGNFKRWFPLDSHRPSRDRIFFVSLHHQWVEIGFTVEDGGKVESIFRSKGLLR